MSFTNIETEAFVVHQPGDDFKLTPIVLDEVRGNEVLVEMKYSGICHTVSFPALVVPAVRLETLTDRISRTSAFSTASFQPRGFLSSSAMKAQVLSGPLGTRSQTSLSKLVIRSSCLIQHADLVIHALKIGLPSAWITTWPTSPR